MALKAFDDLDCGGKAGIRGRDTAFAHTVIHLTAKISRPYQGGLSRRIGIPTESVARSIFQPPNASSCGHNFN
jgi:hypothetical protein